KYFVILYIVGNCVRSKAS
ncbi:hypothetical protein GWI33_022923, partial [Rhynchophorus ferrugineus]